ncbi:MAG: CocE/NonD family hydrolase [Betaproteobacteria bacterium]|nr:CocE/NonD family hydrolase [Betaproteobacteria bacterium]
MTDSDKPGVTPLYPTELVKAPPPLPGVRVIENVYVTMRDGVRLAIDIFMPEKDGKYPALLSTSPYMKDIQRKPPHWSHAIESGATAFYVPKGYIHVVAQGRGAGLSQGRWEWFGNAERTDGYDMIEWIAAQPWCTGRVGMIGDSYWSWTQYHAAIAQPPHLACICQQDSTPDFYRDVAYQGGIFHHQFVAEPDVAIFDGATRQWRYENEYPIKRTRWEKLYFRVNSAGPATQAPYGLLSKEAPGAEAPDKYKMPDSYAQITANKPVVAYATPPLENDLRLWGPMSLTLYGSSTAPDTAWYVKVADLKPDGSVARVTRGILKASFREVDASQSGPGQPFHPFEKQELLEPGKIYEFQIELTPICYTFKKGHRLQVQIASEDIEYNSIHRQVDVMILPWPVENSIHHDAAHPSHLMLPLVPDAPEIKPVAPPVADINWPMPPGSWLPNTDGWPLTGD